MGNNGGKPSPAARNNPSDEEVAAARGRLMQVRPLDKSRTVTCACPVRRVHVMKPAAVRH